MNLLLFIAQAGKHAPRSDTTASFEAGASLGMIFGVLILLAMVGGAIYVIIKWPDAGGERWAIGIPMLLLPFTGAIVFGGARLMEARLPDGAIMVVPASWIVYIGLLIFANRRIKNLEEAAGRSARHALTQVRKDRSKPQPSAGLRLPGASRNQPEPEEVEEVEPEAEPEPQAPAPKQPAVTPDTPVIARCGSCMGRWKTTAGEAKALQACPKCGVSPPQLRLQRA